MRLMEKNNTDQEQLLKKITSLLQKENIPYMITGAISVIFYGRPRASHDIDFVVEAHEGDINRILQAFSLLPQNGFLVDSSAIKDAIMQKFIFQILHLPTMLKFDFWLLKDEPFDQERFRRKQEVTIFGQPMFFASAEDTILIKLLWYKDSKIEKHVIDAAFVYQIQKKNLDKAYLALWSKKHHTTKLLKELATIDLAMYY